MDIKTAEDKNMMRDISIVLFDVDGTLTEPRKTITPYMLEFLQELRKYVTVGIVGGSDMKKISEQLSNGDENKLLTSYDYVFAENGLVACEAGTKIAVQSIKMYLGEEKLQRFINFVLHYIADLNIPVKRGTFIEFRNGMLNVSPIGRNCSQEERDHFEYYDSIHNIRKEFIKVLKEEFDFPLTYSIGGQISFDVFPTGWDKTYCLRFIPLKYKNIHFFGDKTDPGGNDYEIYSSDFTIGHHVDCPGDTELICRKLFM